jgi:predicted RNA-binding Zn ribbon-like protein
LREALYAYVVHLTGGPVPSPEIRRVLNRYAAGQVTLQLDPRWRLRRTGRAEDALGAIAREALLLGQDGRRDAIRWCADATCTRPFLDRSRARRRRWCGMSTCGDKAKAAAYRARRAGTRFTDASGDSELDAGP